LIELVVPVAPAIGFGRWLFLRLVGRPPGRSPPDLGRDEVVLEQGREDADCPSTVALSTILDARAFTAWGSDVQPARRFDPSLRHPPIIMERYPAPRAAALIGEQSIQRGRRKQARTAAETCESCHEALPYALPGSIGFVPRNRPGLPPASNTPD
jgi:hypothetical protein